MIYFLPKDSILNVVQIYFTHNVNLCYCATFPSHPFLFQYTLIFLVAFTIHMLTLTQSYPDHSVQVIIVLPYSSLFTPSLSLYLAPIPTFFIAPFPILVLILFSLFSPTVSLTLFIYQRPVFLSLSSSFFQICLSQSSSLFASIIHSFVHITIQFNFSFSPPILRFAFPAFPRGISHKSDGSS